MIKSTRIKVLTESLNSHRKFRSTIHGCVGCAQSTILKTEKRLERAQFLAAVYPIAPWQDGGQDGGVCCCRGKIWIGKSGEEI